MRAPHLRWWWWLLVVVVASLRPSAFAAGAVQRIDFDTYHRAWRENDVTIVEFFIPLCGYCKGFAPKWAAVAERLAGRAVVAAVDAADDLEFAEEYSVTRFPTLKLFKRGRSSPVDYRGPLEVEDIVRFVDAWLLDCPKVLRSHEEAVRHLANPQAVVGCFAEGSPARAEFIELATERRGDFLWALMDGPPPPGDGDATPTVRIAALRGLGYGDLPVYTYHGPTLEDWLDTYKHPLLGKAWEDPSVEPALARENVPMVQIYVERGPADDPEATAAAVEGLVGWVAPVAERHRGRLVVSLRDAGRYLPALAEDRIDVTSLPRVVIVTPQRKRYIMPDVATPETLPVFLADFLEGRATPVAKSQPPSDAGTLEGLTTLTGETFWREMAGAVDKDVLVEFYAPWCGHCKTLAPIWAELAKTLEAVPTVMIARLDASANDFDEVAFPVAGYPTVFFRRAAKSPSAKPTTPVKYDGPRERAAFLQYLRKHARHPLPLLPDPLVVPPPLPPLNTPPADADDDGRCDL